MKQLQTIMKEEFINYLTQINVHCTKDMTLGQLIDLTKKNNGSNPAKAVGLVTERAVITYENQK